MGNKKKGREGLRVKMLIYNAVESDESQPEVWSEEPLYYSTDEITNQAVRLLERLEDKQYGEGEMGFYEGGKDSDVAAMGGDTEQ